MIKLYHVSFEMSEPLYKEFKPRIPQKLASEEDESVQRICFSDSIQGCIRAIRGYPCTEKGEIEVIIWEFEIDEEDDFLCNWQYLYEENLVPDAAVTHEYWYKKEIVLQGKKYRIYDMKCELVYSIPLKYKDDIVEIISEYIDDISIFERMDPCKIINEWVPIYLADDKEEIIEKMKEVVRRWESDDKYSMTPVRIPDYDLIDMLSSYRMDEIQCQDGV